MVVGVGDFVWEHSEWPRFRYDTERLMRALGHARSLQGALLAHADAFSLVDQRDLFVDEAIATSEIEGETLDRERLRSSVAEQLGLPTTGMPVPDRKSDALVSVLLDATRNYDTPLTAERLFGWQAALFPTGYSGPIAVETGCWRRSVTPMHVVSGSMGRERIHFTAPPAERLDDEMQRFLSWWNGPSREMDGILRAGVAHLYFVTIHPFADGNGRIARALTDMALAEDERSARRLYSLSHRIHAVRSVYYRVLETVQRGNLDITEWLLWFVETYSASLTSAEGRIHRSRVIDRYYRQIAHAALNDRQTKVMRKMIDAYPEGFTGGMTNRKYVSITGTSSESAKRDLADLVRYGLLQRGDAAGRSTYYVLPDPDAEGEPRS